MASPSAWASAARGRIDPGSLLSSRGRTLCTSSRVLLIRTSATLGRFLPRLHLSPMTPTRASFPDAGTLSGSGDTGLGGCCPAQQCPPAAFPPACVPCTKPARPGAEWTVAGSECPHPQALCGAGRGGWGGLPRLLLLAKYRPERVLPLRDRAAVAVAVAPAAFAPSKSVRVRRACPGRGRNGRTSEAGARAGGNQTPFLSVSALSVGS